MDEIEDLNKLTESIERIQSENEKQRLELEEQEYESDESPSFNVEDELKWFASNPNISEEQKVIISQCQVQSIKTAMIANVVMQAYLRLKMKDVLEQLAACRQNLSDYRGRITELSTKQSLIFSHSFKIGMPYFKDKKGYACPGNQDKLAKRANRELVTVDLPDSRLWHDSDMRALTKAINRQLKPTIFKELKRQINAAKTRLDVGREIDRLRDELRALQAPMHSAELKTLMEKWGHKIDWDEVADNMKHHQNSDECKAFWECYLKPGINRGHWSCEEDEKLVQKAKACSYQNWDLIAAQLETNRSAYQCCVHFFSKLCQKFNQASWSPEEDQKVIDAVTNCRIGSFIPWGRVSQYVNNRSKKQIYNRYTYHLSLDSRKGFFSVAEDACLLVLRERSSESFTYITHCFPGRTCVQLRNRHQYLGNMNTISSHWTLETDKAILNHVEQHGEGKWSILEKQLLHDRHRLRHRYNTVKRFLAENPNLDVGKANRRDKGVQFEKMRQRADQVNQLVEVLRQMSTADLTAENVERTMASMGTSLAGGKKRGRKKMVRSQTNDVDRRLTAYFEAIFKFTGRPAVLQENDAKLALPKMQSAVKVIGARLQDCEDRTPRCIDDVDNYILNNLSHQPQESAGPSSSGSSGSSTSSASSAVLCIPPSPWSLVAFRGLLLKKDDLRLTANWSDGLATTSSTHVDHGFLQRFRQLFRFPALMSMAEFVSLALTEKRPEDAAALPPAPPPGAEGDQQQQKAVPKKRGRPSTQEMKKRMKLLSRSRFIGKTEETTE